MNSSDNAVMNMLIRSASWTVPRRIESTPTVIATANVPVQARRLWRVAWNRRLACNASRTSVWHCRSMEMHNLPIRATFCDHEGDPTIGADRFPISHSSHCIQAGDDNHGLRQHHRRVAVERRAARPVTQECLLKILPDPLRIDDNRLATAAQEEGVGRVEFDDAINI